MDIAVETKALRRVYRTRSQDVVALDGVDLHVRRGERFGVLGPNGAGKTTLIKILVTLLLPSSGEAYVDGLDVVRQFRELRHRIAMVSGGENVGFGMLKVKEQLWMFSQFYGMPSAPSKRRIDELLERLGLSEAAELKQRVQQDSIVDLQLSPGGRLLDTLRGVDGVTAASVLEQDGTDRFSLQLSNDAALGGVMRAVEASGRQILGVQKREPTLEDAFVKLVGRGMAEEEQA